MMDPRLKAGQRMAPQFDQMMDKDLTAVESKTAGRQAAKEAAAERQAEDTTTDRCKRQIHWKNICSDQ